MLPGKNLIIFEWSMLSFCLFLISVRFLIRLQFRGTLLSWGDFFVFSAWLMFLSGVAMDTRLEALDFFNPSLDPLSPSIGRDIAVVETLKIFYVENGIYLVCLYCVKFSVLCFYREIIPTGKRKTNIAFWCITAFTAIGCIVTTLLSLLLCMPVDRNWSIDENKTCSAGWSEIPGYVVSWFFHLSSDILIYILPLTILPSLRLTHRQKICVGFTFGLGFLCLFFASAVIAASYLASDFATSWIMCTFEQTWAITVVCVPSFRALSFWSRHVRSSSGCYASFRNNRNKSCGSTREGPQLKGTSGIYEGTSAAAVSSSETAMKETGEVKEMAHVEMNKIEKYLDSRGDEKLRANFSDGLDDNLDISVTTSSSIDEGIKQIC